MKRRLVYKRDSEGKFARVNSLINRVDSVASVAKATKRVLSPSEKARASGKTRRVGKGGSAAGSLSLAMGAAKDIARNHDLSGDNRSDANKAAYRDAGKLARELKLKYGDRAPTADKIYSTAKKMQLGLYTNKAGQRPTKLWPDGKKPVAAKPSAPKPPPIPKPDPPKKYHPDPNVSYWIGQAKETDRLGTPSADYEFVRELGRVKDPHRDLAPWVQYAKEISDEKAGTPGDDYNIIKGVLGLEVIKKPIAVGDRVGVGNGTQAWIVKKIDGDKAVLQASGEYIPSSGKIQTRTVSLDKINLWKKSEAPKPELPKDLPKLTANERKNLAEYRTFSGIVNGALRKGQDSFYRIGENELTPMSEFTGPVDKAFERNKSDKPMVLRRVIKNVDLNRVMGSDSAVYEDKAYLSTVGEHVSQDELSKVFGGDFYSKDNSVQLEIHIPKGFPVLHLTASDFKDKFPDEYLLPRGQRWSVIGEGTDSKGVRVLKVEPLAEKKGSELRAELKEILKKLDEQAALMKSMDEDGRAEARKAPGGAIELMGKLMDIDYAMKSVKPDLSRDLKDAKTVEEMQTIMEDRHPSTSFEGWSLELRSPLSQTIGSRRINRDMVTERCRRSLQAADDMLIEYPAVKIRGVHCRSAANFDGPNVLAHCNRGMDLSIEVNADYLTVKNAGSGGNNGFHPENFSADPSYATVIHEFGHAIDWFSFDFHDLYNSSYAADARAAGDQREYKDIWKTKADHVRLIRDARIREAIVKAHMASSDSGMALDSWRSQNTSEYAKKNMEELIAESWQDFHTNGDKATPVSKAVSQVVIGMYRERLQRGIRKSWQD